MSETTNQGTRTELRICQINLNKCLNGQLDLINSLQDRFDIVCIQEQYYDFKNTSRALPNWRSIYPTQSSNERARTMILIAVSIQTKEWEQIAVDSPDITAVKFKSERGTIAIYNLYNDCTHSDTLRTLSAHMEDQAQNEEGEDDGEEGDVDAVVWLGDFNRHHPMWDEERNRHLFNVQREETEYLLDLIAEHGMEMALVQGINTRKNWTNGNETRPDNVFISGANAEWITKCDVAKEETPPGVDHYPIHITIDCEVATAKQHLGYNWRAVDWEELGKELENQLRDINAGTRISNINELEHRVAQLTRAIQQTMETKAPRKKPSPYMKRWWNNELKEAQAKMRAAARRSVKYEQEPTHPAHKEWRESASEYEAKMTKAKSTHWDEWLEGLDKTNFWDAYHFVSAPESDGAKARIPALKTNEGGREKLIRDNETKSKILHKTFFTKAPTRGEEEEGQGYPRERFKFKEITEQQILDAIDRASPHKAAGESEIANIMLKKNKTILAPHLHTIFNATFELNHYPSCWKQFTTVVLRKPGRPDYTKPNAYRPIALLDTIAKILSSCVKETLEFWAEKLNLLPNNQFGNRPGRTTTDTLHMLVNFTKKAWREKKDVMVVFLDVKGAYPNTVITRLIHDMRMRGIPKALTDWIGKKMEGRKTRIQFDDFISEPIEVENGLDQGCNLSGLLYNFYNAGQLEGYLDRRDELAAGFADDTMCAVAAANLNMAAAKLKEAYEREGGMLDWAKTHGSQYEYEKFGLLGLSKRRTEERVQGGRWKRNPTERPSITLGEHEIKPTKTHKYLGVILDQTLSFKDQAESVIGKGARCVAQFGRLGRMIKGMAGDHLRRLYLSVTLPMMLYAVDVWCPKSLEGSDAARGLRGFIKKMEKIQRKAALAVTGALRTTPNDLLFLHADLYTANQYIAEATHNAAIRIATRPKDHPLHNLARSAARRQIKKNRSSLHDVMRALGHDPKDLEEIKTVRKSPHWKLKAEVVIRTEERAIEEDRRDRAEIKVYTDGSGQNGKIGAAAVLKRGFRAQKIARKWIGKAEEHEVYEAECVGIELGLRLIERETQADSITIATDNQGALKALTNKRPAPGRHLTDRILEALADARKKHMAAKFRFVWVPGHKGIKGNEEADKQAKTATEGINKDINVDKSLRGSIPIGRNTGKKIFRKRLKELNKRRMKDMQRADRMQRIDPDFDPETHREDTLTMPRRNRAALTQLRTEHIALNKYLHKIGKADSPLCESCGEQEETVNHYIYECREHNDARAELTWVTSWEAMDKRTILANKECWRALFSFINDTGRLKDSHGRLDEETDYKKGKE